ncbi:MAG: aminotransferase class V-fold PLP-dependent enzyme [Daejeonella sp.]|uniref:aminotransferase class V-fold PLP-dependent enzyme n=1 Tax=Daejeonella sp. TaxID=2805397 RepID=UPI00273591D9|nr:aminotransferase class V-fold PLP-dependent enzyme [Daejeonella sp.]MDP3467706.1 aminotransferase class V-fold PLP-dependent enzyme [Daejeonella sp.]
MKRREILKTLSILPLAGAIGNSGSLVTTAQAAPAAKRDLFKEFGIHTFINASGYFTSLSGSLMQHDAADAIRETATSFCRLEEVQDKVGERIASLLHAESAMVTAGAFSALMLGMAGVLSGTDQKRVSQIPRLEGTGMKTEVILQKAHNDGYAHALSNCGVKLITVETVEELENAISEKTAMMYFINYQSSLGKIQHKEWLDIARKHQIPTMIDMAADLPPKENLWKFHDLGFDLVCVSGGKFMRGPQSTGILSGKKELIAAARMSAPPRGSNIGRGMKVNKEEIFGLYIALEHFIKTDQDKEWKMLEDRIAVIAKEAASVPGVKAGLLPLPLINRVPTLNISWDKSKIKLENLAASLRNGNPSIEVMGGPGGSINVTSHMLKKDEVKIVASRIKEELFKAQV